MRRCRRTDERGEGVGVRLRLEGVQNRDLTAPQPAFLKRQGSTCGQRAWRLGRGGQWPAGRGMGVPYRPGRTPAQSARLAHARQPHRPRALAAAAPHHPRRAAARQPAVACRTRSPRRSPAIAATGLRGSIATVINVSARGWSEAGTAGGGAGLALVFGFGRRMARLQTAP